jgi:hypothetical protein
MPLHLPYMQSSRQEGLLVMLDYLQLMSDSSCQECPMGQTGQNSVCVDVRPQFGVLTKDNS